MLLKLVFVSLGGACGSLLRYLLQGWVQRAAGATFPVGTLAVNLIGCCCVGFLAAALSGPILLREEHRVGLMIGILGGFTTFSTFGLETFMLANDSQWRLAVANVCLSCGLGVAAVWLSYRLTERMLGL